LQGTRTSSLANLQAEEDDPRVEVVGVIADEGMGTGHGKQEPRKEIIRHYDKHQQLELVLATKKFTESDDFELDPTDPNEEKGHEDDTRTVDIWNDATCLTLLRDGVLLDTMDVEESKRARKRVSNYCIRSERLYFRDLYVPKPEERIPLVIQIHEDLGHAGEERTLTEVCKRYFWHHQIGDVKTVVKTCQRCQMVRRLGSVRSENEEMRSIPVCDLFHRVAMDTARPLPITKSGNRYLLVAIDHYSKWCEAKAVGDHGAKTTASFLEDDIICKYRVPGFILTDNGGEWAAEFNIMCKDYGIQHQHTAPQWPQCNGMVERLIKTIKHGITVLAATPETVDCWDEHLAKVLFGHRCGIQSSTKFSLYMILTGRTPHLRADDYLEALTDETNDNIGVEAMAVQFLQKMKLVASIHENVLFNIEEAQKKQRVTYASKRGKHVFEGLVAGETMVKMKKPSKRRALTASWEGPYLFVGHTNGKGNLEFEEGNQICIV